MFMCTYVYVYVGTQQPYTRNTDLIVKLDWWTAMSPQKFGQCSIRPQGSCRKVRSSKLPFVFSYDRARIRFTDSVDIVPHYHGIPQQILRLVFFEGSRSANDGCKVWRARTFQLHCPFVTRCVTVPKVNKELQKSKLDTETHLVNGCCEHNN